jgi:hypothetical protein
MEDLKGKQKTDVKLPHLLEASIKKNDSGLAIVLAIVSPCLTSPIATQV